MFLLLASYFVFLGLSNGLPPSPPSDRIHGGADAPALYAPHMAALLAGARVVCGASIVSRKHLLTAAHCLTPFVQGGQLVPTFHGRVGSKIWHSGGTLVFFVTVHIHPGWDESNIKNDVGVIVLTEDLVFSVHVAMVGLDFGWVGGDQECFVTGWGTTWPSITNTSVNLAPTPDNLQLLYVKTLSPEVCEHEMMNSPLWTVLKAPHVDPKLEICTFHSVSHGVCHGDSGSAIICVGKLTGVVSWGLPCALGAPDVHARVYGMGDFLRPILETCPSFHS